MKKLSLLFSGILLSISISAQSVTETLGTVSGTTAVSAHEAANGFDLDYYTYSGTGDIRVTTPSPSGGANVFLTNSVGRYFQIDGLNTDGCSAPTLQFLVYKSTGAASSMSITQFLAQYSTSGSGGPWTDVDWGGHTLGAVWITSTAAAIPASATLSLRFYINSTTHQVRIDDIVIDGGTGCTSSVLPVSLSLFSVNAMDNAAQLHFTTATERNNAAFEVERSNDGRTFEKIGEVKGAGNSVTEQHYTFEDKTPARGINYYRLRQVDFDGNSSLSVVRSVVFGKTSQVTLFPTPATEVMNVRVETAFDQDAQWQIMDMNGRIVSEGVYFAEQTEQRIPVNTLTEGIYVLRITAGQEVLTQQFRK